MILERRQQIWDGWMASPHSVDMNLGKFQESRGAEKLWCAIMSLDHKELDTTWDWTITTKRRQVHPKGVWWGNLLSKKEWVTRKHIQCLTGGMCGAGVVTRRLSDFRPGWQDDPSHGTEAEHCNHNPCASGSPALWWNGLAWSFQTFHSNYSSLFSSMFIPNLSLWWFLFPVKLSPQCHRALALQTLNTEMFVWPFALQITMLAFSSYCCVITVR